MPIVQPLKNDQLLKFDETQCREAGEALAQDYREAQPYPHIVMEISGRLLTSTPMT